MVAAEQEFLWVTNAEPHATRRREILAKHGPEVRKLYGTDTSTAWQVCWPPYMCPVCRSVGAVIRMWQGVNDLILPCTAPSSVFPP